jgi:hypothetical protein
MIKIKCITVLTVLLLICSPPISGRMLKNFFPAKNIGTWSVVKLAYAGIRAREAADEAAEKAQEAEDAAEEAREKAQEAEDAAEEARQAAEEAKENADE